MPVAATDPGAAAASLQALTGDLAEMKAHLLRDLEAQPFVAASTFCSALAADITTPHRLPRLLEIERALTDAGVTDLVTELRDRKPDPSAWPGLFEAAWIASSFDRARLEDPGIAGFNGRTHDGVAREFARLDRERLILAAGRVRRAHAERAIEAMNRHPEQEALVRREAAKKSRHLPVRALLAQAPEVLTALRPCWMASPLQVSQLLDGRRYFDVVLFDEASQVLPEDAIPSLMRAERAVVAGDRHQLPPTVFFMAGDDEDAADSSDAPAEGFESLLDIMGSFLEPWSLDWHYRSRDESLIAFSNRHIYGERLVTFPGPGGPPVLSHVLVEGNMGDAAPVRGAEQTTVPPAAEPSTLPPAPGESSAAEVRRVVELILEHATTRPTESLGVIAMGIPHARRIEEALEPEVRAHPPLQPFFDPARPDRFFVKNLERVQGDERDAIILTVGYGKDRSGKLPYRFGPLLMQGGERRLNVAVTRARKRLTLVSSFSHIDMDPGRSTAKGVELLRLYLEYAAGGGHRFDSAGIPIRKLDPFQASVLSALTSRGLKLEPQWGASKHRIDFAVRHPNDPSRFALAIECDGPEYAASPTARDRDRLRPQILEALGWRHHRIWSLDWFSRREEEIELCLLAYKAALEAASGTLGASGIPDTGAAVSTPTAAPAAGDPSSATPAGRRGPRPAMPRAEDIDDYTPRQIDALLAWIESDGRLRTDDEILDEMTESLGFKRRGSRIEAVVNEAIRKRRTGIKK
jgi:very-short-patch-repair endonuclease